MQTLLRLIAARHLVLAKGRTLVATNKPDAAETVVAMMEDLARGIHLSPAHPDPAAIEGLVRARQPQVFTYADWRRLDALEVAAGKAAGRPRAKFTRIEDMRSQAFRRG